MCILVVEDEPLILMVAAECLEDAGYEVMTAEHALEAIALIQQSSVKFTVLVTDYHMPHDVTGGQLVQHMRQSYPDIPMLITTARTDAVTKEFRERHRVQMLAKPYSPSSLVTTLGRLLARTQMG